MKWKMTQMDKGKNLLLPFLLITILFFMWGFAHSMLDVLNKHFQDSLHISLVQAAFVQNAVYGGYFIMAIPAGKIIVRHGYKAGILTGLILFGIGALLFIPGSKFSFSPLMTFYVFVFSLFIIGCGLTCLETSANPYATVLGNPKDAERRINFAQSFNGLGWILGPLVGLYLFRGGAASNDVVLPYTIIGCLALLMALFFSRTRLPEVTEESTPASSVMTNKTNIWQHLHFRYGLIVLMLYVAAQTGVNSFFINYTTSSDIQLSPRTATLLLAFGSMSLFMLGRLLGAWLMQKVRAERLLAFCGLSAALTMIAILFGNHWLSLTALLLCYLFESIMFPTIFSLSIRELHHEKKRAGSYLVMSIVGGAIAPTLMAAIADYCGHLTWAFIVPLCCYIIIFAYGIRYRCLLSASKVNQ